MDHAAKLLITGAEGQLGVEICRQARDRAVGLGRQQLDPLDPDQVARVLRQERPAVVINTAAYTAVDRAEQEPAICEALNADAVATLADLCAELDCTLVQISTDYVFGADRARSVPYVETDFAGPVNVYGHSKLAGEVAAARNPKHVIVRTCGLYGRRNKPSQSNFVDTMLRLGRERSRLRVVNDQHCTPSYTADVARAVLRLASCEVFGTYHIVNSGETTWYELASEVFRLANMRIDLEPISTEEYGAPADRPRYSVLDASKLQKTIGLRLPDWRIALAEYLATLR